MTFADFVVVLILLERRTLFVTALRGPTLGIADPDPCVVALFSECGFSGTQPQSVYPAHPESQAPGTIIHLPGRYCSFACAWNNITSVCYSVDNYPAPATNLLADLVGASSPLKNYQTLSFYGDR